MLFSNFPLIEYPFVSDKKLRTKLATDVLVRLGYSEELKNNEQIFSYYRIREGETPEIIADKLYGTPEYHWTILLFNDIIDPYYGWNLQSSTFDNYMRENYPGTSLYISSIDDDNATLVSTGFSVDQTIYKTDGTLQNNNTYLGVENSRAVVYEWNPTFCELVVDQSESTFRPGDLISTVNSTGTAVIARVNRVQSKQDALHHFEKTFTSGSSGPTGEAIYINPLSEASGLSAGENQVIGSTLGFNGNVTLADTFIGVYSGVTGAVQKNNFAVSNRKYELDKTMENARIKLIRPKYIKQLPKNIKELIDA